MDAYGEKSRAHTYQPWQSHIPVASSYLTLAVAAARIYSVRACVRRRGSADL
jgi:hypothetical protein